MGIWETYGARIDNQGGNRREIAKRREIRYINSRFSDNLSRHIVEIDGVEREVVINDSDNFDEKTMISLPGEDFDNGALVKFQDHYWLIVEKDYSTELYTRVKLEQCNHLLRWIDEDHVIREQYCIVHDGTKYMSGEWEDPRFILTRGDTRIQLVIGRNEHTAKLNRTNRFIIDDPESTQPLAYTLSKSLRTGHVYEGKGVFAFVLQEVHTSEFDNFELGIADYYLHFPKNEDDHSKETLLKIDPDGNKDEQGRSKWL